jgi:hypothetical protein
LPVSFVIDTTSRRVTLTASGVVTGAEIFEARERLARDSAFEPTFSLLFDFTPATEERISPDEIRELAIRTVFRGGSRRAYVVDDRLKFALTRMSRMQVDEGPGEIRIFPDKEEAERWLAQP